MFGLTSTGFVDYYEAAIVVERRVSRGLTLLGSYTWSQATDNLPGQLAPSPFDRVSPFPEGVAGGSWDDGPSDLDVTHRFAATVAYAGQGMMPLGLAARFRFRSGLPFTPGFRSGIDVNGDGSGENDPAFLGAVTPGMADLLRGHACLASQEGEIAARNSCRDDAVQSLDLHASIGLTMGSARRVFLTLDAFNVLSSESGIFDHAAVRVDPLGTISFDGSGRTVLPLVANPRFGTVLSRRSDPRLLRVGLRLEN